MGRWSQWSLLMSTSIRGKLRISLSTANTEVALWQHLGWEPAEKVTCTGDQVHKESLCVVLTWETAGLGNACSGMAQHLRCLGWYKKYPHVSRECHFDGQGNWQVALPGPPPVSASDLLRDLEKTAEQTLSCKVRWPRSERGPWEWIKRYNTEIISKGRSSDNDTHWCQHVFDLVQLPFIQRQSYLNK